MHSITKEIKEVFDWFKRNSAPRPVRNSIPFSPSRQMWMYYFLFPEVLLVYDDWTLEKYKECPCFCSVGDHRKVIFATSSGEALLYPCEVLPEEEVLRIMEESKILQGNINE